MLGRGRSKGRCLLPTEMIGSIAFAYPGVRRIPLARHRAGSILAVSTDSLVRLPLVVPGATIPAVARQRYHQSCAAWPLIGLSG